MRQYFPEQQPTSHPAVQEVQWLEKQVERREEDIPELKHDVRIFDSVLNRPEVDDVDAVVARFYRAKVSA